ncbi:MAG: class I SAM-dependent methyltransferase family protein [Methanosarcinaceae archaeon]|nr:class I SAM-dependent methyltransferase family protein [Methanosarcinaceae archaeon]
MKQRCIKVPKKKGESVRRVLLEFELLDHSLRIASDASYLYLPLSGEPEASELAALPVEAGSELTEFEFEPLERKPTLEELLGFSPRFEVIGDIVLLEEEELEPAGAQKAAAAILETHPRVKTVMMPLTPVIGEFRVRDFEILAGERRTETVHREHGSRYMVDLAKAYFTPRLSTERIRVLEWVREGDTVVDMFAGVGPYSILIAKKARPKRVLAIDKNPEAVNYLRENIALNSVQNIEAIEGDAREEAEKFAGLADHVLMNLPHSAHEFLDSAVLLTKPGGIIHYYGMTPEDDLFESSIELIRAAAVRAGRKIEVLETRTVRSYAPHQYNICIEVRIL